MHKGIVKGTYLLTPYSKVLVENIKPKDLVLHSNGKYEKVISISTEYLSEVNIVKFKDDEIVTGDKILNVFNSYWAISSRIRPIEISKIQFILDKPHSALYFALPTQAEFVNKEKPPISPYLMGVLLGDGSFRYKNIFIVIPDEEIKQEVIKEIPKELILLPSPMKNRDDIFYKLKLKDKSIKSNFNKIIKEFDLEGKYSYEKEIPDVYMNADIFDRISIIQGLMDTDGTSEIKGGISFTSTSLVMVKQLETLIRSIGGIGSISSRYTNYTYKGHRKTGREAYTLTIRISDRSQLFKLPRKKNRVLGKSQYSDKLKRRILSVSPSGKDYCYDVETNGDSLLVYNNYITLGN